jgi:hypothetical protein
VWKRLELGVVMIRQVHQGQFDRPPRDGQVVVQSVGGVGHRTRIEGRHLFEFRQRHLQVCLGHGDGRHHKLFLFRQAATSFPV